MRGFLVAVSLLMAAGINTAVALPPAGKPAPDFALKSDSGRNIRLSELRGQVVLINFWATWCPPCRQELPQLNDIYTRHRSTGFMLLAVNVDDKRADAEAMIKRLGLRFPTLFDEAKKVAALYRVDTMPSTLLVDRDGRVRYVHRGYLSGYEKKYEQQVRELLKE